MLKSKEMNLHAMNIMTVMLSESDLMLMMVESSKSQNWPDGLVYILWEKLLRKFKPSDQIAAAKQTVRLYALKLGRDVDPTVLEEKIASLEARYGIPISKVMKISAIMKAAGKYYSDTIQSKTRAIQRPNWYMDNSAKVCVEVEDKSGEIIL